MLAQEEFDKKYITSSEICKMLGVSRATVMHGKRKGVLPNPISVGKSHIVLWEREPILPILETWKVLLKSRKREAFV